MTVRAAGGVPWRKTPEGLRFLVIHRPRYDDWSLPKGKRDRADGSDEDCARREVEEETGLRCELGEELPSTRYRDRYGRDKIVRYWTMRPVAGEFVPNDEVDVIRWVSPEEARSLLEGTNTVEVVDAAAAILADGRGR